MLFGSVHDQRIDQVEEGLASFSRQQGEILHLLAKQLSVTRAIDLQTKKLTDRVYQIAKETQQAVSIIEGQLRKVEKQARENRAGLTIVDRLSVIIRTLELEINRSNMALNTLIESMDLVGLNKLSRNLLPPLLLSNVLSQVASRLPEHLSMVTGTDVEHMHEYYSQITARAFADKDSVNIVLELPLTGRYPAFKLFRVHEWPSHDSYLGRASYVRRTHDYLLVREDLRYFADLDEKDLAGCSGSRVAICKATFPLYTRDDLSCSSAVYLGDARVIAKMCERRVLINDHRPLWVLGNVDGVWRYNLPTPQDISIYCRNSTHRETRVATLHGQGQLALQEGCEVTSASTLLMPSSTRRMKTTNTIRPGGRNRTLLDLIAAGQKEVLNETTIDEGVWTAMSSFSSWSAQYNTQEVTLNELINEVQRLRNNRYRWIAAGSTMGGVTGFIALLAAGWWIWRRAFPTKCEESVAPCHSTGAEDGPTFPWRES